MSLINDALKRAQAAQDKAPQPEAAIPHLRPVEPESGGLFGSGLVLPVALTVVALGGLFFLWHAAPNNTRAANVGDQAAASTAVGTRSTASLSGTGEEERGGTRPYQGSAVPQGAVVAASNAPAVVTAVVQSNAPAMAAVAQRATAGANTNLSQASAVTPPKPPPPRLQGIMFSLTRPSALIGGKTVFVGDYVGGLRVAAITRESATLVGAGVTNRLRLEP